MQPVTIAGGREASLAEWMDKFKSKSPVGDVEEGVTPGASSMLSSAPGSPHVVEEHPPPGAGRRVGIQVAAPVTQV